VLNDPAALRAIASAIAAGEPLPADARAVAAAALTSLAARLEPADERRARRDTALRDLVGTYLPHPLERRCALALAALDRYAAGRWRFDRLRPEPPPCAGRDVLLHQIMQNGPPPTTTRQLRNIVAAAGG
jgi:hypothetical protein